MAGETEDRGDNWTPTEDVEDKKPDPAKAEVTDEDLKKVGVEDKAEADEAEGGEDKEDKEDKEAKKKAAPRIPLARHKEILEKEREQRAALEKELANVRQGQQLAATNEQLTEAEDRLLKLEESYAKLVTDGDAEKAGKTMSEIRRLERSIIESKSMAAIQAAEGRAYERVRYDTTVERLEAAYPALNPDHDDFDEAQTREVVELRDAYVATGRYSRAEAIQKAVKTVMKPATVRQERAVEAEVRVDKADLAKAAAEERAKAARSKAVDAATRQPPNTNKVGLDSDKLGTLNAKEVMKMGQDEFAKLDEKTLAKLRGDEFVGV